jgi:hypothetical protein
MEGKGREIQEREDRRYERVTETRAYIVGIVPHSIYARASEPAPSQVRKLAGPVLIGRFTNLVSYAAGRLNPFIQIMSHPRDSWQANPAGSSYNQSQCNSIHCPV